MKGKQAAEKCAAVSPSKAPSVLKTKPPPTQKPAANAKAPAPPKSQAESWQPWRSTASVLMAAVLVALVAMSCSAFGFVDATSLASAGGAQPALYTNTTGDLDVVSRHPGICFDPMADDRSSVLSAGNDLLHREAVCGELGVRCDAAGLMTEGVHANMLRPPAPGLGGARLSDWHNLFGATEGMQCTPKSLPCMHYLQLPVPTISSNPQLGLHGGGTCSSLTAVKETDLLTGFGSRLKESALLAELVTATAHAAALLPRLFALLHFCAPLHLLVPTYVPTY